MASGKLIIEVYEYSAQNPDAPRFEFVPCMLDSCIGKKNSATLDNIIRKGFSDLPKKAQNEEKQKELLQKLDDAGFSKINVVFGEERDLHDTYVELSNVLPVSMAYADARRSRDDGGSIILSGRYSFSDSGTNTKLKDAQRLTIIFSGANSTDYYSGGLGAADDAEDREVCLNITYLAQADKN